MKFKYLGTAASEGWPSLFCSCDNCKRAIAAGGRNIRSRSQAIIDDRLLIDFPPDTYLHVLYQGLDLTKVHDCIVTHNHTDHFYPGDLENRQKGYAYLETEKNLTIYGARPTGDLLKGLIELYQVDKDHIKKEGMVDYQQFLPFVPFPVGKYTITPLKADHDPLCDAVIFIISDSQKTILYANDTGYFPDNTWEYLAQTKPLFDFVSLDCTYGTAGGRYGHMGLDADTEVKNRFLTLGLADESTIFYVNHFSHNGISIYDEIIPEAKKLGFSVSYDGLTLEI